MVLEAAKLVYANKTKGSITSQRRGTVAFWQIINIAVNGKFTIRFLFNWTDLMSSTSDKGNSFLKMFLRNITLMT